MTPPTTPPSCLSPPVPPAVTRPVPDALSVFPRHRDARFADRLAVAVPRAASVPRIAPVDFADFAGRPLLVESPPCATFSATCNATDSGASPQRPWLDVWNEAVRALLAASALPRV